MRNNVSKEWIWFWTGVFVGCAVVFILVELGLVY
jgi:hypothetical protein